MRILLSSLLASYAIATCPDTLFTSCTSYVDKACQTESLGPDGNPQDDYVKKERAAGLNEKYSYVKDKCLPSGGGAEESAKGTCDDESIKVLMYNSMDCSGDPF